MCFYPLRLNSEKHVATSSRILVPTLFAFTKDVSLGIWCSDNGVNKSVCCLSGWSWHTFSTPSSLLPSHYQMQPVLRISTTGHCDLPAVLTVLEKTKNFPVSTMSCSDLPVCLTPEKASKIWQCKGWENRINNYSMLLSKRKWLAHLALLGSVKSRAADRVTLKTTGTGRFLERDEGTGRTSLG